MANKDWSRHPLSRTLLEGVRLRREAIRHAQCEIAEIESMLDLSGFDFSLERVSGSKNHDRLANSLHALSMRKEKLATLVDAHIAWLEKVDEVVALIPNATYIQFLNMRYIECVPYDQISKAMCYSVPHLSKTILNAALDALEEVLECHR